MASEVERLVVALEAKVTQFNNALNKANRTAQTQLKRIESQFAQTNKKLTLNIGGLSAGAGAFGAALGANQIKQYADAWTEAGNKIKSTSVATGVQARSLSELNDLANKSRSGFTETVDLYTKLLRATKGVAQSEDEVAKATDIVNKAFKAGGAAASEQAAGILQLSQALGSGVLQGDELRSLRENSPLLAKAIADEFGTTIAGLKKLGAEGELTSDRVFKAILKAGPQVEKQFAATTATIADGFELVSNAATKFVGKLNDTTGAGNAVGDLLKDLATIIENFGSALDFAASVPGGKFLGWLNDVIQRFEPLHAAFNTLSDPKLGEAIEGLGKRNIAGDLAGSTKQILALFDAYRGGLETLSPDKLKAFDELRAKIAAGTVSAKEAKAAIAEIVGDDARLAAMAKAFDPLLEKLQEVVAAAKEAAGAILGISEGGRATGFAFKSASDQSNAATRKLFDDRSADAQRSSLEKEIETRTDEILAAAKAVGASITEAAARIQAQSEIASENAAKASDASTTSSMDLIKKFEGFRTQAYFDVNKYRVGFGSDTVTLSDGSIQRVTAGMTTTLAAANADLARRIQEFQAGIEGKIGADTFRGMSEQQQAALTSIAYNYGSLPDRIVEAIKTGNTETVYNAIKGLGGDNGGINQTRRSQEADLFLNGASTIDQADIKLREDHNKLIRDTIAALAEETATIGFETAAMGMSNAEREKARVIRETLLELEKQGIPITDELRAAVEAEAAARYGQVSAYDAAAAASDNLKQKQEDLLAVQEEIGGAFQDAFKGFISDLVHGKSATEALSDAVSRLADRLMDIALDQVFKAIFSGMGGGGGLLGGLLGFASGGYTGDGGTQKPAGVVHGKEFVVNARATKKNRRLLEAMNAGAPGYAQGGYVGRMAAGGGASAQPAAPTHVDARTKVINAFDAGSFLSEALNSTAGEKIMLNFVRARPGMFKSAIGG